MKWIITGLGRGLGEATADAALARGDTVIGIVRKPEAAKAFEAKAPGRAIAYIADVTDREAVFAAVSKAIADWGVPDVVVNNAGQVLDAYVEEADPDAVRALFEVNLIGQLNIIQAVLPHFRERGSGKIANISSGGGILGVPAVGLYSASKFAVEGMTEALAQEVGPLGIQVTIIEPGAFRTQFLLESRTAISSSIPDYEKSMGEFRRRLVSMGGKENGDPAKLAQAMLVWADSEVVPLRLALGDDAIAMALQKAESIQSDIEAWKHVGSGLAHTD